jgi:peptidoglycan/LPS O-acetylase OafA/YrhL
LSEESVIDPRSPAPAKGQPRPPQISALTSIRFLAALYVATYHLVRPFERWGSFAGFMGAGYTGVSFFFLLSGFILTYSHASEKDFGPHFVKRFYFARFARIYPVYVIALIASVYVYRYQLVNKIHLLALVADILMVQTWSIRMVSFFNVPAWSISSEVFFYLVFPWIFLKLRPRTRNRGLAWFAGFWALAMVPPFFAFLFYPGNPWVEGYGLVNFFVRRLPLFALPEFLAGVSLAWLYLLFGQGKRHAAAASLMSAAGILVVLFFAQHIPVVFLHNGLLLPLFATLLLSLCQDTAISRALSSPPLILLGEASYAFYLIHYFLANLLTGLMHLDTGFRSSLTCLAITLPVAIALHLWVERPCRRELLRWWNRNHEAGTGTARSVAQRLPL